MKNKRNILIEKYNLIKEKYGKIISVRDLSIICCICIKTIIRYLNDNTIFSTFSSNTHIIHVESLNNKNYIPPSIDSFHKILSNLDLYCEVNKAQRTIPLPGWFINSLKVYKIGKKCFYSIEEINFYLNKNKGILL